MNRMTDRQAEMTNVKLISILTHKVLELCKVCSRETYHLVVCDSVQGTAQVQPQGRCDGQTLWRRNGSKYECFAISVARLLTTRTNELAEVRRGNDNISINNVEEFRGHISEWNVPVNVAMSHTDMFQIVHIAYAMWDLNFKQFLITFSAFVNYVIICHRRN